jgi:plasmid maintenance system antidote protein VapI
VAERRVSAGEWLSQRAMATGLSNAVIAETAGLARRTVDRVVNQRVVPSLPTLVLLDKALGYGEDVAVALRRPDFDAAALERMCAEQKLRAMTARQMLAYLVSLPAPVLDRPLMMRGRWVRPAARAKIVRGMVMVEALLP